MRKKYKKTSTQADICLKYLKKSFLFTCLLFFKAFKRKRSPYKNIWTKVTYYIMGRIFCASFCAYKKYLEQKLFITS